MTTMIVDELGRIPMSPFLTATLTRAADYATAQSHREVTLEHLLLALSEDPEATVVLKTSHIDLARLTADVNEHLARSVDRVPPGGAQPIAISADLKRILEAAAAAAQQGRRREINGAIVLAAIVGDGKSMAAHLLRVQGLTFEEAIRALKSATPVPPTPAAPARPPAEAPAAPAPPAAAAPAAAPPPSAAPAPSAPAPAPAPIPRAEPSLPDPGPTTRPPTTEEILASARERLQASKAAPPPLAEPPPPQPVTIPRANFPDLGGARPAAPDDQLDGAAPQTGGSHTPRWTEPAPEAADERFGHEAPAGWGLPAEPASPPPGYAPAAPITASRHAAQQEPATAPPRPAERRRASSGPFVGSWPLIEAGQLVENIPRRMRVGIPIVVEARIARADVKALAEGLQGSGAAFRHEIVVTKAMSVRLRAPEGGFIIENRSPETQWIENVLGLASDDFASWRWTVTPRARGRRQLQLIVSARTVGADGTTAETALPDQTIDVKVAINYARTFGRWIGWIAAAVIGGLLARFGETAFVILKLLAAKYLGI